MASTVGQPPGSLTPARKDDGDDEIDADTKYVPDYNFGEGGAAAFAPPPPEGSTGRPLDCGRSSSGGSGDQSLSLGRPGVLKGGLGEGGGIARRRGNVGFPIYRSAPPRSVAFAGVGPSMGNLRSSVGVPAFRTSFRNLQPDNPGVGHDSMKSLDFDPTDPTEEDVPINLHAACRSCESLRELKVVFRVAVNEMGGHEACGAEEASGGGRLPLHCIGLNKGLLQMETGGRSAWGRIEKFIMDEFITAHPAALTEEDDKGRIPFTEAIHNWVRARRAIRLWRQAAADHKSTLLRIAARLKRTLSNDSPEARVDAHEKPLSSFTVDEKDDNDSSFGSVRSNQSDDTNSAEQDVGDRPMCEVTESLLEEHEEDEGPSDLPPLVEFCLRLLSATIDWPPNMPGKKKKRTGNDDESMDDDGTAGSSGGGSYALSGAVGLRSSRAARRQTLWNMSDAQEALYADVIVEKVAAIPGLMRELLLIEEKDARARVFDMSVVKRALLCSTSFGDGAWLNRMLIKGAEVIEASKRRRTLDMESLHGSFHSSRHSSASSAVNGVPEPRDYAEGAVFYLERISALSPWDVASPRARAKKKIGAHEINTFRMQRDELYIAVGGLDNLITNMVVFDDDLIERVAASGVVQRVLDEVMSLPVATTMTFLDLITRILFILSFRAGPCRAMFNIAATNEAFDPHCYILWWMVLLLVSSYFFYRKINQMIAKWYVSKKLFLADIKGNFWTQVDLLSLLAVVSASIAIDCSIRDPPNSSGEEDSHVQFLRFLAALATGLVWLKLMGLIKMLNKHLATFVLCSMEILKDIKYFLIVLTITLAAFAQMFVSMMHGTQPGNPEYGSMHIYFKAYGIMLGDFDTTNFSTGFLSILFVVYTFVVTIVLLNILIAIVSASYDRSMASSKILFGKARVQFVAELMAIHTIYELIEGGELHKNFRCILVGIEMTFAAICTKMVVTTVKLRAGDSLQSLAFPVEVEAAAFFGLFLFMGSILFKLRLLSYKLSMEIVGKRKPMADNSTMGNLLAYFVFKIQSLAIKYLDYSNDNSDLEIRALMNSSQDDEITVEDRHAFGINRALSILQKQMKAENEQSVQQLKSAFNESEERFQQEIQDIEERLLLSIAESGERIANMGASLSEERIAQAVVSLLESHQGGFVLNGGSHITSNGQDSEPAQDVNGP